jgi:aspartyl-tRNA(Asn)/glutamyl-tRNA(Gln) amidotransferase subunit C
LPHIRVVNVTRLDATIRLEIAPNPASSVSRIHPLNVREPAATAPPFAFATRMSEKPAGLGYDRIMATLSRSDVEHVAHLARLGLTEDELTLLEGQLNHILDQYAILTRLDTEHIPPTAQTIELENILRDDVAEASLPADAVLANAPAREGDFFLVPPILTERD